MKEEYYNLGFSWLGTASYDQTHPGVTYFSLGEFLAVIAILLAFLQLMTPISKFRLKSATFPHHIIYIAGGCSVLSIILATLVPVIPGAPLPLLGYPLFWEIISFLILIISFSYLIFVMFKKAKFNKRNCSRYIQATSEIILKNEKGTLYDLAEEIEVSINYAFKEAAKVKNSASSSLLEIWADSKFCDVIIESSYSTMRTMFSALRESPSNTIGGSLNKMLIQRLFLNEKSFLMREESSESFNIPEATKNMIFSHDSFNTSKYSPLEAVEFVKNRFNLYMLEKYCECVQLAFESHFKNNEKLTELPSSLNFGINFMAELVTDCSFEYNQITRNGYALWTEPAKMISCIQGQLAEILRVVIQCKNIDTEKYNVIDLKDHSIYSMIAKCIYKYFSNILWIKNDDSLIRMMAIDLWLELFSVYEQDEEHIVLNKNQISNRLVFLLKDGVDNNLNIEKREYPALTKLLIQILGLWEGTSNTETIESEFKDYFLNQLKTKFMVIENHDPKFAMDLIPENVVLLKKELKLQHKRHRWVDRDYWLELDPVS